MIALDTNVLARFFVDDPDDPEASRQRDIAVEVMKERAFVSITVLLELEWVLRGFYQLGGEQVSAILHALLGIEHIAVEDRGSVLSAIDAHAAGLDFADAMHVARSGRATSFRTFDKRLARAAKRLGSPVPVELLTA